MAIEAADPTQKPPLSWRARFAVGVFLVIGGGAAYVGFTDAFHGDQFSSFLSRLLGVLLLAAGTTILVAAMALLTRQPWAYDASALGGGLGTLVGASFMGASIVGGDNELLWLWAAVVGVSLLALATMVKEGHVDLWHLSSHPKRFVVSILSIGTLLSLTQFGQSTVYVPSVATPILDMSSQLGKPSAANDGILAIPATVTIKNASDQKVRLVASQYTVAGWTLRPVRGSSHLFGNRIGQTVRDLDTYPLNHDAAERGQQRSKPILLQTGPLLQPSWYFDKGEEYSTRFLVYVPVKRFPYVQLTVQVFAMKATVDLAGEPEVKREDDLIGGSALVVERRLRETSIVNALVRPERTVRTVLFVQPKTRDVVVAPLYVLIDRKGRRRAEELLDDDYTIRMQQLYGLVSTHSISELSLGPMK